MIVDSLTIFTCLYIGFLLVFSAFYLGRLVVGRATSKIFSKLSLFPLILNQVQAFLDLYIIFAYGQIYLSISSILAHLTILAILLLNVQVLQVYSVLDKNLTPKKLYIWRIVIISVYFITCSANLICVFMTYIPVWFYYGIIYGPLIWAGFGVVYDNSQAVYLTYLVYSKNKQQGISKRGMDYLRKMCLIIIFVSLFDWIGLILYGYTVTNVTPFESTYIKLIMICDVTAGTHANLLIYVINELKKFTFVNQEEELEIQKTSVGLKRLKDEKQKHTKSLTQSAKTNIIERE